MGCCSFLKLFIPVLIRSTLAGWCGAIEPKQQTVSEGTTVYFSLHCKQTVSAKIDVQWLYEIPGISSTVLCDSKDEQCKEPTKYTQSKLGIVLTIESVSLNDSGLYFGIWYIKDLKSGNCSERGILNVTKDTSSSKEQHVYRPMTHGVAATVKSKTVKTKIIADTRARKQQHVHCSRTQGVTATVESKTVKTKDNAQPRASNERELHQKTISTEITTEYHSSTTDSATAKVESETKKTGVIDSATDYKVSSTVEDTSQFTTIVVAGVVALGVMLTVVAVVIICKKQTKNDIHRASQKSGPTQTLERRDGQNNSLSNNSGQPHSRQQSERLSSDAQHEAEHNPGALYDHLQASRSAAEQINSEYATVVPKKDRISSTQQRETNKVVMKEKEGTPEYATVVKSRQPGCSVEQSTQGGKDKNEHGPLYADLDLVSGPRKEGASRENGATEFVSIYFQKTTKLKSQQK